ncbi:hypothetical protein J7T55_000925 [Diaporthe amygdali]|uniref:uncharacterized protein n=1 Tax=Phomopsis amygdali TaxID=1214568 RepID=UPI0022FDCA65|nr:uncharacterized protein J7T55_000925 [Diaporthe amygdali]KAJ0120072.1 hypothetical protein J7T55_000925 [Diaporthe amygdali]
MDLNDKTPKVAIVTGAASGIGKALATDLVSKGWHVACCDIASENGEAVAAELGEKAVFYQLDVCDYDAQANVFSLVWDKWGRLDALLANAGHSDRGSIYIFDHRGKDEIPPKPELKSIKACYESFLYGVQLAIHFMRRNETPGGQIVATSTIASIHPHQTFPEYCGAKAAKENITMNAVLPGIVITGAVPQASIDATRPEHITPVETVVRAYNLCLDQRDLNGQLIECSADKTMFLSVPEMANGTTTKRACTVWEPLFKAKHHERRQKEFGLPQPKWLALNLFLLHPVHLSYPEPGISIHLPINFQYFETLNDCLITKLELVLVPDRSLKMSGLEGLGALGLACSIFQVISFGRETLSLVKDVYRHGTLDESLMDKSTAIQGVASDIIAVDIPQPGKQERKLVDVTKKCTGVARDLQEEIAFLVGHNGKGSLRTTLKIAAKANWRKRRLERMEKDLDDSEQLMHTTLLAWVFKSLNRASIDIDSLGQELRNFVIKYQQGSRTTSELVSKEALQVREVIARESEKTEKGLRAHITQTSAKFEQKFERYVEQSSIEQIREKLLKSLKYPGMNERANQVEDAHERTFRWLFEDGDEWSESGEERSHSSGSDELDDDARSEHGYTDDSWEDVTDQEYPPEMVWSSFTDWLQSDLSIYCIMVNVTGLNQKDDETDWSVPELERLCIGLIRDCGQPMCLFIDGLDECGTEDSHQNLLALIEKIILLDVKFVVSSRDEPIFEKRFRHEPQLRVQDLTAGDLYVYARDMLPLGLEIDLHNELVEKAEGVFLWLALAGQSINRGLTNADSLTELHARVKSLPKGLEHLYEDMWERLNEDHKLYRESAALYLKIAMGFYDEQLMCPRIRNHLEMMLASHPKTHIVFAKTPPISIGQLLKEFDHRAEDILKHDGTSPADITARIIRASLRANEILDSMLRNKMEKHVFEEYLWTKDLQGYLSDLSRPEAVSDDAAKELFSLCFEQYISKRLLFFHEGIHSTRIASFFGLASQYPSLNRYSISIIDKQCIGSASRSAVMLSVVLCAGENIIGRHRYDLPVELLRWLLSLPGVDVNVKCPLILLASARENNERYTLEETSPLDHIKVSPFIGLLATALLHLAWNLGGANEDRSEAMRFIQCSEIGGLGWRSL